MLDGVDNAIAKQLALGRSSSCRSRKTKQQQQINDKHKSFAMQ
jgi:hypothetical protein